jgi:arylsulfatase A-like enzyme
MNDTEEQDDPGVRRIDRRTFVTRSLRAGGAIAAGSLGADALLASSAPAHRRVGAYKRSVQPNILVILVDQLREPRWFGPAGGQLERLPASVARLARGGVRFARHYAASNDCSPARATLVTGLHTHQTGCLITGVSTLDPRFPTWGSMLGGLGYSSWWFGKWHLTNGDRRWNEFDGPRALARYGFKGGTYPSPNGAPGQGWRVDPTIADQFVGWLESDGGLGPWCTTVSFVNPHDIAWWWRWSDVYRHERTAPPVMSSLPQNFETPRQLEAGRKPRLQLSLQETSASAFGVVPFDEPRRTPAWLPFLDLYVKLQLEVDHQIDTVMRALAARPQVLENTVVVFSSDHGEYGGSHGLRGKGAGMYEEAIRVPLVLRDYTGAFNLVPGQRSQISSSVDVAPLLLSIASGSGAWRESPDYAHIADRPDLLSIAQDPSRPGRQWAVHATDEVITEFALTPYAADAPLHVTGIVTPSHKYATYSNWRGRTMDILDRGQEAELYDYTTPGGLMEVDNLAGRSGSEETLRGLLDEATRTELRAPLPASLQRIQRHALHRYHDIASLELTRSSLRRLHEVERVVNSIESQLPASSGGLSPLLHG